MPRSALLLALALLSAAGAQRPIETATFLTGAWGQPWDDASRELYLKAGFNLIGYSGNNADWAVQNGLKFISSVGSWGLPSEVNRPFEAHDGTRSGTVGLFTSINFNAPSVEEWWQQSVPKQVASQKHADQVAFWKVHNEFGYHAAKVWDYSPGSIARYQRWLGERYPSLAELNRRWGTQYAAYGAIQPPRALPTSELANWLEWRRFTCWNFGDYFRTTGDLIRRSVPGAAVSDNLYPVNPMEGWDMFDLARQTDYVAFDIYSIGRWDGLISSLDKGRSAAAAWSKPFVMMEYHAGPNNWIHEVLAKDLYIEANLGLAREMRALQWYMWRPGGGGREQGIHGMLDSQGRPTERYTAARDVSEKTARLAPLLQRSRLQPPVAIVVSSDNSYLAYGQRGDHWAPLRLWENLGRLLDDARIPHEAIDPTWLAANDPSRYRAIIVANVALLGEHHLARLRDYAAGGGTVIFQPDSGRYDDLGQRRAAPLFDSAATEGPVFAKRLLGGQEMVVETVGQGRIVKLSWELPSRLGDGDLRRQRSQAYAKLLAEQAGIQPAILIDGDTEPWKLDAMLLTTPEADLLYLTALSHEPREKVEVSLGRVQPAPTGYLLRPGSSAVERLPLRQEGGATRLTIPRLDPAVIVVLPRAWQPLVGIESPARLVAGGRYAVAVTVDNLGAESVGGAVALTLPAGWTATPATGRVDNLAPGNRASVPFEISVPAEAALDRFAIDYPLTARVTFDRGRSGALSATALPFLVPAIDLAATYQGKLLNPWQEMAPAIMRWGWDSEVRIPPPPPVAIGAAAPVTLTITADPSLRGQTAQLRIEPAGSISPTSVALTGGTQTVAARLRLEQPGPIKI
ncbi:MAG: beta-galactosidase, partial [Armatimonadetes bacterium]|nr:beta-galactosidase [Armatimonadota bacterium]